MEGSMKIIRHRLNDEDGNTYPCGYRGDENLGLFQDIDIKKKKQKPWCRKCDWECFRDPSFLVSPIINPALFLKNIFSDKSIASIWTEDILYYFSCEFFNGRVAPNLNRLNKFCS